MAGTTDTPYFRGAQGFFPAQGFAAFAPQGLAAFLPFAPQGLVAFLAVGAHGLAPWAADGTGVAATKPRIAAIVPGFTATSSAQTFSSAVEHRRGFRTASSR